VRPNELERRPQERLEALGPAPRAELLHVLMLPDFGPTGSASSGATQRVAPSPRLLIDCEEDRVLRAVLVGTLRERP